MYADHLFIVKKTALVLNDPAGLSFNVTLPSAFTDFQAAKTEATSLLRSQGYDVELLPIYEEQKEALTGWKFGESVLVHAEVPGEQVIEVAIDTVPNDAHFVSDGADGARVTRPLFHVVRTTVDYGADRSGMQRSAVVEGTHCLRSLAYTHAKKLLHNSDSADNTANAQQGFVQYDERTADGAEWPFGEDAVVHAVQEGGINILVSVVDSEKPRLIPNGPPYPTSDLYEM